MDCAPKLGDAGEVDGNVLHLSLHRPVLSDDSVSSANYC
jgi:hypothetical protein